MTADFFDSTDPVIQCGSKLRFAPKPNTVAVYQEEGEYKIFDPASACASNEKNPIPKGCLIITNPNVKFVTSLKTDLINKNYPAAKEQFTYYTKDSVQVGVKLFVAYRIADPKLAIEKLGPTGIDGHIEHVTHVDMAKAGQETSLQGIQGPGDLKIGSATAPITEQATQDDNPPSYNQLYLSAWQESVKKQLEKDLKEYGIQLIRLNIEEISILNKEVEEQMGQQAIGVAKANADLAAIKMQKEVALQKTQIDAEVTKRNAWQEATRKLIEAESKKNIVGFERETILIKAQADVDALKLYGDALRENPELSRSELVNKISSAFASTNVHTLFFAGNNSLLDPQNSLLNKEFATNSILMRND